MQKRFKSKNKFHLDVPLNSKNFARSARVFKFNYILLWQNFQASVSILPGKTNLFCGLLNHNFTVIRVKISDFYFFGGELEMLIGSEETGGSNIPLLSDVVYSI